MDAALSRTLVFAATLGEASRPPRKPPSTLISSIIPGCRPNLPPAAPGCQTPAPHPKHHEGTGMVGERATSEGWARYSTEQFERIIARLPTERGVPLPGALAELEAELARRRDADERKE